MKLFAGVLLCVLLAGCTFSNVASYVDKGSDVRPFKHLIVVAGNLPLGERQAAEQKMASVLQKAGLQATLGTDVMPPTRLNDQAYINQQIAASGADGILQLYQTDRSSRTAYVPPTVLNGGQSYTTGRIYGYGSMYSLDATTTYTAPTIIGGYTVEKPIAGYGAAVYDLRLNGRQVWKAEVDSSGGAFDSYSALAEDAANAAVQKLKADGLI